MTWGEVLAASWVHVPWAATGCVCAFFAPKRERGAAIVAAVLLVGVWVAYLSTWTPQSLSRGLSAFTGTHIEYEAVWSFTDALAAMVVMAAWSEQWWGIALWLSLTVQCSGHVASQFGMTPWGPYRALLDGIFAIQWSLLILIGGPGIVDHISSLVRRYCHRSPAHQAGAKALPQQGLTCAGS